ncbi:hypothetical protein SAMN05216490_3926 [Mucilaginibacter mallensis]|uniref:RES domain-containing protein n=1 Tax=Mucilaginibacter mallensis TaxID=652787 RepID=A0A1H2B5F7_MUCMA|nr:hypothetical protein [Mucilaginibacter mallensis]SDT53520.1 hypothetical protein SAMN05216490_3926 [Mucilaginibacter mallensis]
MLITPTELLNIIKLKKEINFSEYPNLKNVLYDVLFSKMPVLINVIRKGDFVYRTVPIYRNDITLGRKKYLSYRPIEYDYPYFNRCSEPEQRHFYCSTTRHLSIGECSYFISESDDQNKVFTKNSERLEVGMWEVTKDIYVIDMRFGNFTHEGTESHQIELKEKYNQFAKEQFIKDFFDYINELFELPIKKESHLQYWLTACYSNYLFDDQFEKQPNWGNIDDIEDKSHIYMDGILYHSVKGIQTTPPIGGYNLALKTELIDNNSLKLIRSGIFETNQIGEKEFVLDNLIKINRNISGDSWYYEDPTEKDLS